jgi:hypothetical protein
MDRTSNRSAEQVRLDIEEERERLAASVEDLRAGIGEATDINAKLAGKLPAAAAAAAGLGFLLGGGVGATMRLVFRRGREGKEKARFGPFSLIDRD